jgi:probable phosphoglycerate mutase
LVRHGESTWNVLGLVQGHHDEPTLTELGRRQSEQAAEQFKDRPVGALYASDLRRAQQTAEIFRTVLGVPIITDAALRERSFGVNEGHPLNVQLPAVTGIDGDRVLDVDAHPVGGESLDQLYRRAADFIHRLQAAPHAGEVIVISHGGCIRALRAYCAGVTFGDTRWDDVDNASAWPVRLPVPATSKIGNP